MLKKCLALFTLTIFLLLASGCGTIKGAAEGAFYGAKEDWEAAKKADQWFQENLW
ncbi:MAG: hypothetical protein ABIG56_00485 [Candidatus Omnitrophota bacterium]